MTGVSFGIYLYRHSVDADRVAVRAALARWGWDGSHGSPYHVGTSDGVTVELYATGLDDPKLMVCRTPEELEAAIEGGFDA